MPFIEVTTDRLAAGGDAIGRGGDGKVVFVAGALPGERVRAEVVTDKRDFTKARTVAVLEPSRWRRTAPCAFVADGCGGCDWQHVDPVGQGELKASIVRDALARLGGLPGAVVDVAPALPEVGYRTTVRLGVRRGAVGFRAGRSHEVVAVDRCLVAHPLLDELIAGGRFLGAREVTLRCGARTGERLALASPSSVGLGLPDDVAQGPEASYHEIVAGSSYRISAESFFQSRPDGADALVAAVREAVAGVDGPVLDAYGGVGLFAKALARGGDRPVTLVERSGSSIRDARHNLAGLDATIVESAMEDWEPSPYPVVVADPAREGLGRAACDVLTATGAERFVLVSCDAASLGRDTRLLTEAGYRHVRSTLIDLFVNTAHVEVVTEFRLA
ncbi:MAG: class I SAM-dependent RNA methyltransferase [Acidimicrobiia bacterium]